MAGDQPCQATFVILSTTPAVRNSLAELQAIQQTRKYVAYRYKESGMLI
jgi:hypothetical protein